MNEPYLTDEAIRQVVATIARDPAAVMALADNRFGLEKESLRVTRDGHLALTPHPQALGSPLCHPHITTDYSESLLEFVTGAHSTAQATLNELKAIHQETHRVLAAQGETLWCNSMPCFTDNEADIPIARYGQSNIAMMKEVYRLGLGHRYGRTMQIISGIHYNFSVSDRFWPCYQRLCHNNESLTTFKNRSYLGLIRNFHRFSPLIMYLFGASPTVCGSFVAKRPHGLQPLGNHDYGLPYATSLRMGPLGYQSAAQQSLAICYNSLDSYITSLTQAICQPFAAYQALGLCDEHGNLKQLNTAILQIENEFYSTIRPKRITASGETPLRALTRSGIEYVEVRCIDVDPFCAIGITKETMYFLEAFMMFCLLQPSPIFTDGELHKHQANVLRAVQYGRDPDLTLDISGQSTSLTTWAQLLLERMEPVVALLDSLHNRTMFKEAWLAQQVKVHDASLTPSAQLLATMSQKNLPFAKLTAEQSRHWQQSLLSEPSTNEQQRYFTHLAENSFNQLQVLEASQQQPFDEYLRTFYEQYQ